MFLSYSSLNTHLEFRFPISDSSSTQSLYQPHLPTLKDGSHLCQSQVAHRIRQLSNERGFCCGEWRMDTSPCVFRGRNGTFIFRRNMEKKCGFSLPWDDLVIQFPSFLFPLPISVCTSQAAPHMLETKQETGHLASKESTTTYVVKKNNSPWRSYQILPIEFTQQGHSSPTLGTPYDVDQNEHILSTCCFPSAKCFGHRSLRKEHLKKI